MATITADLTATFGALTLSGSGSVVKVGNLSVTLGALTLTAEATRQAFVVRGTTGRGRRIARNRRLQAAFDLRPSYLSRSNERPRILTERHRIERSIRRRDRRALNTAVVPQMLTALYRMDYGVTLSASNATLIDMGTDVSLVIQEPPFYI